MLKPRKWPKTRGRGWVSIFGVFLGSKIGSKTGQKQQKIVKKSCFFRKSQKMSIFQKSIGRKGKNTLKTPKKWSKNTKKTLFWNMYKNMRDVANCTQKRPNFDPILEEAIFRGFRSLSACKWPLKTLKNDPKNDP